MDYALPEVSFGVLERLPLPVPVELVLDVAEELLGCCVVDAVALPGHALGDSVALALDPAAALLELLLAGTGSWPRLLWPALGPGAQRFRAAPAVEPAPTVERSPGHDSELGHRGRLRHPAVDVGGDPLLEYVTGPLPVHRQQHLTPERAAYLPSFFRSAPRDGKGSRLGIAAPVGAEQFNRLPPRLGIMLHL